MRKAAVSLFSALLFIPSLAFSMAQWDRANRPELMELKYERNFSKLPLKAKLKTLPWSDDYWPTYKGGITYRWNKKIRGEDESSRWSYKIIEDISTLPVSVNELSPAEKYDLYLGREDFPLTKHERQRTKIMKTISGEPEYDKDFKIPEWEGLCHAWAPATLHYKGPEAITVVGKKGQKITFASSDVHALLTYHLHLNKSSKTNFLGSRCNLVFADLEKQLEEKKITQKEFDEKINTAECKDTNAGAFHVALVNQIGLMDQGFVVDVTRDSEVWNQPVYSFEVKVLGVKDGATEGAAPGTVKEITVFTKMGYVSEIEQHLNPVTQPYYIKVEEYKYRVELNAAGEIIGGEWISFDRPDFIWKSAPVPFKGYFKELEGLYKKSVQYLAPIRFSDKVKLKILKKGRLKLIEKEFIKDLRKEVALTKLRKQTARIVAKHLSVEAFKEAGEKEKSERIASHVAFLKKKTRTNFLVSKFIDGTKEDVRNSHVETALGSVKKELNKTYLASKFIEGVKADVRDTHIEAATSSVKNKLHQDFLVNTFIDSMKLEVTRTKIKETVIPVALGRIFVAEVRKDAKKTRKIKEANKKAAKAEVMTKAAGKVIANKFVTEVSKDAQKTRIKKEANKARALKKLNKFSNANFYSKKFIAEVKTQVLETRRTSVARRLDVQKKLDQSLMEVAASGNLTKFQELVKQGANPAYSDEAGLTPLMIAVQKEQKAIIATLLKTLDQKSINAVDKQGRNALIWAIVAPNQRPDRDTRSIVRDLLEKNIEVNQRDSSGKTALGYVTSGENKSKLIQWALKEKGAKV